MSAYHNQTNISPGTLFSGSGSNFPQGININNLGSDDNILRVSPLIYYWGQPILANVNQYDVSGQFPLPMCASEWFAYAGDGNTSKSGSLTANQIKFQGSNGSGNQTVFLSVNDAQLGSQTTVPFNLAGVSTIQAGTYQINAQKAFSTLIGLGYA